MDRKQIEKMKHVDVRTIDAALLKNVNEILINTDEPKERRMLEFVKQIRNPFCFVCDGVIVKLSYSETGDTLENKLAQLCLTMEDDIGRREYIRGTVDI